MKTFTLFLATALAATALAGCANNGDDRHDTNMTPTMGTPTATTTMTPTTPTGGEPGDGGPPEMMECHGDYDTGNATGQRLGMPELSFTAKDPNAEDPCFAFVGPRNATAGWNAFSLNYPQGGRTFHIMPMYFIGEHTMEEVMQAFASESEPEWAVPVGAVGGVTSGQTGSVAIELEEGSYVFFCPIEGHMFQGMMGMLHVAPANDSAAPEPVADVEIELSDYNFTVPEIRDDVDVIRVTNNGSEPHEAPLVRLNPGTNMSEFLAALEDPNATGPPPGALVGGANTLAPGKTVYLLVDLEPDTNYGMVCFVESEEHGGMPHIALGMVTEFEVGHNEGDDH